MGEKSDILKNILDRFDKNDNDTVPKSEFKNALDAEGVPTDTADLIAKSVYANWDKDDDESVNLSELKKIAERWASYPGDQSH